jgi:hypothetical protein
MAKDKPVKNALRMKRLCAGEAAFSAWLGTKLPQRMVGGYMGKPLFFEEDVIDAVTDLLHYAASFKRQPMQDVLRILRCVTEHLKAELPEKL